MQRQALRAPRMRFPLPPWREALSLLLPAFSEGRKRASYHVNVQSQPVSPGVGAGGWGAQSLEVGGCRSRF